MLFDSFICRRKLDEERGNPWICECPMCRVEKLNGEAEGIEKRRPIEAYQEESKDQVHF